MFRAFESLKSFAIWHYASIYLFCGNWEFGDQFEERWQTGKFWLVFPEDSEEEEWALPLEAALPVKARSQGQTIGPIRRLKVGGPDPLWSRSKGARGMATGHSTVPYCCACLPVEGAAEFEIRCSPPPILLWRIYTGMSLLWGGWCCAPQNCT